MRKPESYECNFILSIREKYGTNNNNNKGKEKRKKRTRKQEERERTLFSQQFKIECSKVINTLTNCFIVIQEKLTAQHLLQLPEVFAYSVWHFFL